MSREKIIEKLKKYFQIEELVCHHTAARFGEQAWQFLDTNYLHALLVVRSIILQAPMTCNTKTLTQRGLRCNMCALVKDKKTNYLSAHILGKAGDFTVQGMTAEQARQKIINYQHLLPCNIRLEGGVTWLHLDVLPTKDQKVYVF